MVDMLHKGFNAILASNKTPVDFSKMIVSPIHKKGEKLLRKNFRTIALLSIPGIFLKIFVLERINDKVGSKVREKQLAAQSSASLSTCMTTLSVQQLPHGMVHCSSGSA